MLVVHVEHGEAIDKALKRYKNKHRNIKQIQELRRRQFFTKKSIQRRNEVLQATYKNKKAVQ